LLLWAANNGAALAAVVFLAAFSVANRPGACSADCVPHGWVLWDAVGAVVARSPVVWKIGHIGQTFQTKV